MKELDAIVAKHATQAEEERRAPRVAWPAGTVRMEGENSMEWPEKTAAAADPAAEARALLARQQEREREASALAEERDELPCRPVLDMPPSLLAALCDEIESMRLVIHAAREVLSMRWQGPSPAVPSEKKDG